MAAFLRRVDGMKRMAGHLAPFIPKMTACATYWAPFLGTGNLFLFESLPAYPSRQILMHDLYASTWTSRRDSTFFDGTSELGPGQ